MHAVYCAGKPSTVYGLTKNESNNSWFEHLELYDCGNTVDESFFHSNDVL